MRSNSVRKNKSSIEENPKFYYFNRVAVSERLRSDAVAMVIWSACACSLERALLCHVMSRARCKPLDALHRIPGLFSSRVRLSVQRTELLNFVGKATRK